MFIYKYMAGLDDSPDGDVEDESYDPHAHRKVPKPTTYAETMTHMIKGCLGAGLLAMPDAVHRMGIIIGVVGILGIGIFATYCIQILILAQYKLCRRWKRGYMAYPKSMRLAVESGPPCIRWSANFLACGVDVMLVLWQVGICAIYFVFVAENVVQVLQHYGYHYSVRMVIIYLFPFMLVLSFIKDLKLLAPFSTLSNFLIVVGLMLVCFYLFQDDFVISDEIFELKGIAEIPVFIGITLFALEAVGVILALEYNMENPKHFTGVCGLFSIGITIILIIYTLLGVFGYMKYGENIKGVITLNLPEEEKKAQVSKLSFALAISLSFPLQNFVAYQIIWRKVMKKFKTKSKVVDYFLRVMLVVLPFCMSVGAPSLGAFMGLMGALCLSLVAIVFPAIIDICVYYPNNYGCCRYRMFMDLFIIIFGTCCMFSGVYTSILEIYEAYNM